MPEVDAFLASPALLLAAAVIAAGAFLHGCMGMGFPLVTTPLIAAAVDLKTAILVTVLPNIAVNLYSIARGGNWSESLGKHWRVAVYVPLGSVVGTQVLIAVPAEPLKLLLAASLAAYLAMKRLRQMDWSALARRPRASEAGFGLAAGFLSGTVSVSIPPLVIYFMALGLAPNAMVQVMNLCFLLGKATQAATLAVAGEFTLLLLGTSIPLAGLALACLAAGTRLRERFAVETYYAWLNRTLLAMALLLVGQVAWAWMRG